jgi:hypothetical protein
VSFRTQLSHFLFSHHLRARASAQAVPKDSDPSGPWIGEEVLWKPRCVCRWEENPAQAHEEDKDQEQAEEATQVCTHYDT